MISMMPTPMPLTPPSTAAATENVMKRMNQSMA